MAELLLQMVMVMRRLDFQYMAEDSLESFVRFLSYGALCHLASVNSVRS